MLYSNIILEFFVVVVVLLWTGISLPVMWHFNARVYLCTNRESFASRLIRMERRPKSNKCPCTRVQITDSKQSLNEQWPQVRG